MLRYFRGEQIRKILFAVCVPIAVFVGLDWIGISAISKVSAVKYPTTMPLDEGTEKDNSSTDKWNIVEPLIKRGQNLCINFDDSPRSIKRCTVRFDSQEISSEENQNGNITVEITKNVCTVCIHNFDMESLVNQCLIIDSELTRLVKKRLWRILKDKLAVVVNTQNDQTGNITITTIGKSIQCFIQIPSLVTDNTVETKLSYEQSEIMSKRCIHYKMTGVCSYTVTCNVGERNYSIIHETQTCSGNKFEYGISTFGICVLVTLLCISYKFSL